MSIDQNLSPSPVSSPPTVAAIENEFPTYRAISPHAVLALVCGLLAIPCIISLNFLPFAVAALVFGFYAERKIQRHADILTGRRMAQAGIALGLIFGLGATTFGMVQGQIRRAEASRFSKRIADVLMKGSEEEVHWYKQHPERRRGKTPAEVYAETLKGMRDPHMMDMELGTLKVLRDRLASTPGAKIEFSRIESDGAVELDSAASALFEVHWPASTGPSAAQDEYALIYIKGVPNAEKGRNKWWIEPASYPYTPNTFVAPVKHADDGHGHAH